MQFFYPLMWVLTMNREYLNGDRKNMMNSSKKQPDFTLIESIQWGSSWPQLAEADERHKLFGYMEDRFGIPEKLFDDYLLFKRQKSWTIMKNCPYIFSAAMFKVSRVGLKAFQKVGAFVKPTTRLIQTFGHAAIRAKIEINEEQLQRLQNKEDLPMDLDLKKGYVILSLGKNMILGFGFYGHGKIKSQIPLKELRRNMFHFNEN